MKAVFIETSEFTEWVHRYLPEDLYLALQLELMENPAKGDVIKGCGELRKLWGLIRSEAKENEVEFESSISMYQKHGGSTCWISMERMKKMICRVTREGYLLS